MYYYWGFGLHILSEIEFPELLSGKFEYADVTVTRGIIPDAYNCETKNEIENEYFLEVKDICRYYVKEGKYIVFQPYDGIDNRSVRLYILATVMAYVLLYKGSIPLHASGILKNNELILFAGDSGAGKSTTLASLAARGYTLFTDDVCVLQKDKTNEDKILGIASYPLIKLWDKSISLLHNESFRDKNFRIKSDIDKFGYFFHETFSTQAVPVGKIFILKTSDKDDEISHRKLSGIEAFKELEKQAYRKHMINNQQLRSINFNTIYLLANHCEVIEVIRPLNGTLQALPDKLETLF